MDTILIEIYQYSLFHFCLQKKHPDLASLQAQSTGEDSNSSDHSAASDAGDYDDTMNGSMDQRFSSFLGLQGIPGLLPGPSGMNDSFGKFTHLPNFFLLQTTKKNRSFF